MSTQLAYQNGGLHVITGNTTRGSSTSSRNESVTPKNPPSAPKPQPTSNSKSQKYAAKSFREKEFVVEGNAVVIANPNYEANKTISIEGVGKVLSGQYYVETVRHTWSRSGYTQQLELRSNTAGGLKPTQHPPVVQPKAAPQKTHTVKKGDTLWALARQHYGNGNQWRKIWEANKSMLIQRDARNRTQHGHWIYPGQKLIIP